MSAGFTILVADDEPNIVVPLKFLMEKNGYHVVVAQNGREALEAVRASHPDLVLLDIMLPVADGYEVFQGIRENPDLKDTRIVFISALGRGVDVEKCRTLGADAYIKKPFANSEVLATVKRLIG